MSKFEPPRQLRIALKICDRAIDMDSQEQAQFVADLCASDPDLMAEVEVVLNAIEASDGIAGFLIDRVK